MTASRSDVVSTILSGIAPLSGPMADAARTLRVACMLDVVDLDPDLDDLVRHCVRELQNLIASYAAARPTCPPEMRRHLEDLVSDGLLRSADVVRCAAAAQSRRPRPQIPID